MTCIFTLEAVDILSFLSLVILICCSSSFIFNFRFSFSDRASSSAWKNESKIEKSSWLSTVFGFSPKCFAVLCNVLSIFWRAFVSSASLGSAVCTKADRVGTSRPSVNEAWNIYLNSDTLCVSKKLTWTSAEACWIPSRIFFTSERSS